MYIQKFHNKQIGMFAFDGENGRVREREKEEGRKGGSKGGMVE